MPKEKHLMSGGDVRQCSLVASIGETAVVMFFKQEDKTSGWDKGAVSGHFFFFLAGKGGDVYWVIWASIACAAHSGAA